MLHIQQKLFTALNSGGKPAVCAALQQAIELEHATIPPYLYALYSLEAGLSGAPGPNAEVAATIRSVVDEEMLHMTLACNVLNALGGAPSIDRPDFIPKYPGHLPGTVEAELKVGLEPFSQDLMKRVFMWIEEPEYPLEFRETKAVGAAPELTIGEFYRQIERQIRALGPSAFDGDPKRQVQPPFRDRVVVTNLETACRAIDVIVSQGEGTRQSPQDLDKQYAHYYRFSELWKLRRLVPNPEAPKDAPPDQRYVYGPPIPFDAGKVYSAPNNPKRADYPPGSAARHALDNFNYTYTSLLKTLHALFNGQPELFPESYGLMMSLRQQAIDMMAGTNLPKGPMGPSFEYQPVNPKMQ